MHDYLQLLAHTATSLLLMYLVLLQHVVFAAEELQIEVSGQDWEVSSMCSGIQ
jgi:hypothetical protein